MLYRTVYGPELKAIYEYVAASGTVGEKRTAIHTAFAPHSSSPAKTPTQNIDDALSFLVSAYMLTDKNGVFQASHQSLVCTDFRIQVLHNLRQVQTGELPARHMIDPTFMLLLEELYAAPRQLVVSQLPVRANQLAAVQSVGGLSREKLQAWRRVMCYLGLGVPLQGEFVFSPESELIMVVLQLADDCEGSLQSLIEEHLTRFLPCTDRRDELTPALERCLIDLMRQGRLTLFAQQDAPSRPYGASLFRGYHIEARIGDAIKDREVTF